MAIAAVFLAAILGKGQEFEVTRSTIDNGGVMRSTGGNFELSSTVGQLDAGNMTGGEFELTGGFWFALAPFDCDEDGGVGLFDYAFFQACADGPAVPLDPACICFDANRDGLIDLVDFGRLQLGFHGAP